MILNSLSTTPSEKSFELVSFPNVRLVSNMMMSGNDVRWYLGKSCGSCRPQSADSHRRRPSVTHRLLVVGHVFWFQFFEKILIFLATKKSSFSFPQRIHTKCSQKPVIRNLNQSRQLIVLLRSQSIYQKFNRTSNLYFLFCQTRKVMNVEFFNNLRAKYASPIHEYVCHTGIRRQLFT